jgi:hypothetical protein
VLLYAFFACVAKISAFSLNVNNYSMIFMLKDINLGYFDGDCTEKSEILPIL